MQAYSLSDFWGKRWNLSISSMLRDIAFHPICEGRFFPEQPANTTTSTAPATARATGHDNGTTTSASSQRHTPEPAGEITAEAQAVNGVAAADAVTATAKAAPVPGVSEKARAVATTSVDSVTSSYSRCDTASSGTSRGSARGVSMLRK